MSALLSQLLWAAIGPSAFLVGILVVGLTLSQSRKRRLGMWLLGSGTVGFLILAFVPVDSWVLAPLEHRFPRPGEMRGKVDGIVVLGGAIDPILSAKYGMASLNDAAERMTETARLGRLYPNSRILFTGGSRGLTPGGLTEAETAKRFLEDLGVNSDRITLEDESRNTFENASFSKRSAGRTDDQVWLLITSAAHMPRAIGVFRQAGWNVTPWPVAFKADGQYKANLAEHLQRLEWAIHEWEGLVVYRVLGRIDCLFPSP